MEQQNQNPLANLSVTELKSLAYDNLTRIQQAQSNLQILNEEINARIQAFQQAQTQQTQSNSPTTETVSI